MGKLLAAACAGALLLGGCELAPPGRCQANQDCLAGQICASGVCSPAPPAVVDRAPVAAPDAYTVVAGAILDVPKDAGVLANDVDPDGDPLVAEKASSPAHGTAFLSPDGRLVYVPAQGFTGTDVFTYRASDGTLRSAATAVTITVTP